MGTTVAESPSLTAAKRSGPTSGWEGAAVPASSEGSSGECRGGGWKATSTPPQDTLSHPEGTVMIPTTNNQRGSLPIITAHLISRQAGEGSTIGGPGTTVAWIIQEVAVES